MWRRLLRRYVHLFLVAECLDPPKRNWSRERTNMADVIHIAKERRKSLAAEITKLDEFIQMAGSLMKWHESKGDKASEAMDARTTGLSQPMPLRAGGPSGTATAGGA